MDGPFDVMVVSKGFLNNSSDYAYSSMMSKVFVGVQVNHHEKSGNFMTSFSRRRVIMTTAHQKFESFSS